MVLIKRTMENIHQIAIKCLHNKRDLDNKQKPCTPPTLHNTIILGNTTPTYKGSPIVR